MKAKDQQQITQSIELRDSTKISLPLSQEPKPQETQSQQIIEQIEDDLTSLRNKKQQSPLSFYLRFGNSYCFSFDPHHYKEIVGKILMMIFLTVVQIGGVKLLIRLPEPGERILQSIIIMQCALYLTLFILDPGTLIEDEQQKLDEDRYMCRNCRLYRNPTTVHCLYCRKCVRGYDHHCSFFLKCIGARNYFVFCAFIVIFGFAILAQIVSLFYTALHLISSST